mmetsp:Transcript_137912/g.344282  ORF Transcript_137912/g.344282 Transcript_137912/m.344282 type:complete len:246 (-) Transcript_137912:327-1064(-)
MRASPVFLGLFADKLDLPESIEVRPHEDQSGIRSFLLFIDHIELVHAHGVGVHADRHENVQQQEEDHDDVHEDQDRPEQVTRCKNRRQVYAPRGCHDDGHKRAPDRCEQVVVLAVAHMESHSEAKQHQEQQAGEQEQVYDAPLDDAHVAHEDATEREVLQHLQPSEQAQTSQDGVGELEVRYQLAEWEEHLRISHDLRGKAWLTLRLPKDDEVCTNLDEVENQDDNIHERPKIREVPHAVLAEQV